MSGVSKNDTKPMCESVACAPLIPRHVGIIMDGNGRWAQARNLPRFIGHKRGAAALDIAVHEAIALRIEFLTVYAFSIENWKRPHTEVNFIFGLLASFLKSRVPRLREAGVRLRVLGSAEGLSNDLLCWISEAEEATASGTKLTLSVLFNYGGREEIANSVRNLVCEVTRGERRVEDIDEVAINRSLYDPGLPDVDLIIRTSGEQRLSNFLIWQAAWSELVFISGHWPDFDRLTLKNAVKEYGARVQRRLSVRI